MEGIPKEYIKISQFNQIPQSDFESSPIEQIEAFVSFLRLQGLTVEFDATDGSNTGSACGQLRGMQKFK